MVEKSNKEDKVDLAIPLKRYGFTESFFFVMKLIHEVKNFLFYF